MAQSKSLHVFCFLHIILCSTKYLQKIKIQKTKSNLPSHPHLFSSRGDPAHIERFNLHTELQDFLSWKLPYQILYFIPVSYLFLSSHVVLRLPKIKSFGGRGISPGISPGDTRLFPYFAASGCCTIMFFCSRKCEFFFQGKPAKSKLLWSCRSLIIFLDGLLLSLSQNVWVLFDTGA